MHGVAETQSLAAPSLAILGRPSEAEPLLEEALETARTLGDRRLLAHVQSTMGLARSLAGAFDSAHGYLTEALRLAKILGADVLAVSQRQALPPTNSTPANPKTSYQHNLDALAIYRALNSPTAGPISPATSPT